MPSTKLYFKTYLTPRSLSKSLLIGIFIPVLLFITIDTFLLYKQALVAVNIAYDRTLLASAKSIGEQLIITGQGENEKIEAHIQYSAVEAFEADMVSQIAYQVIDHKGRHVDGVNDLPPWKGTLPNKSPFAALVDFYDDVHRGRPVRVAVLLQPVASTENRAMVTVQVAETLELRQELAKGILKDTLIRQAFLALMIVVVTYLVVLWAIRPVKNLSEQIKNREPSDLSPIQANSLPTELQPIVQATNDTMSKLGHLLTNQKRFVRDTAHQLRTPLAVLKTQVQSTLRGDVEPLQGLQEIRLTVDRATTLANQMLSLAKVEQLRSAEQNSAIAWHSVLREIAIELSPLIAEKNLDFVIDTEPCQVLAHEWMMRELCRNLLHNAITFSPLNGRLHVYLLQQAEWGVLRIEDEGGGIADELLQRLCQPFSSGNIRSGSGLGLSICQEICRTLHGKLEFNNRVSTSMVKGLEVKVSIPLLSDAVSSSV